MVIAGFCIALHSGFQPILRVLAPDLLLQPLRTWKFAAIMDKYVASSIVRSARSLSISGTGSKSVALGEPVA